MCKCDCLPERISVMHEITEINNAYTPSCTVYRAVCIKTYVFKIRLIYGKK